MKRSFLAHPVRVAGAVVLAFSCLLVQAQNQPSMPLASSGPQQPATVASLHDSLLARATTLYASSTKSGLHSFACQVHPDWKKMMSSSRNGVPVAADDVRLALLSRVNITVNTRLDSESTIDWQAPTDMAVDAAGHAMLDKAHRGIEQTLDGALKLWIPLVNGSVAESLGEEDLEIAQTAEGYTVRSKDKQHSLAEDFDRELLLKRFVIGDSGSTVDIAPTFRPTGQGLLLSSVVARVQAAGATTLNAQEMHISLEYQTVSGAQIPARVDVVLPNVVEMDFLLDGCSVNLK